MRQLAFALSPPPPSLENFVAGRNAEPVAMLRAITAGTASERFVYLWGDAGCGKTHLLQALAGALTAAQRPACLAGNEAQLMEQRLDSPSGALLADNVDRLSEQGQSRLFQICIALREAGGWLIAAGNAPPALLPLRADLVTRLGWGLVYQLHSLSDEEKVSALIEHAQGRGFALSPEVVDYLLHRQRRDLPNLIALLDALDRYSLQTKRAITVPLVRELLSAPPDQL
ncbi:MAG: DnaA regulatory inactivator Hda [Burkholderiales bacterium]